MEPWIGRLIDEISIRHKRVFEVGCGQGTDAYRFCSRAGRDAHYCGIDYSPESVAVARAALAEARELLELPTEPTFGFGDAEQLDLPDNSQTCVLSNGVLHHTSNPRKAFAEIYRILQPGGEAYISLYRKPSLKLSVAKTLRAIQKTFDFVLRTDRVFYRLSKGHHVPEVLGTMILECFGVPYMGWYTRRDMEQMFSRFEIERLATVGYNLPFRNPEGSGYTPFGYMWLIHLRKPLNPPPQETKRLAETRDRTAQ